MPEADVQPVQFGLQQEHLFVECLKALGLTIVTSSFLDAMRKTDACITGTRDGPLPSPIHLQFTTVLDYLPKMESFLQMRELRKERGIYVEMAGVAPDTAARYLLTNVLPTLAPMPAQDRSVLFVRTAHKRRDRWPLDAAIRRLKRHIDAEGVRHTRLTGTVVGFLGSPASSVVILRDDGVHATCSLKSCADSALYFFLRTHSRRPDELIKAKVRVSFLPAHAQATLGYGLLFQDPAWGRWVIRLFHERLLLSLTMRRLQASTDPQECAHLRRLAQATTVVLNDLYMDGAVAGYEHILDWHAECY